jgi:ATP adenylyltransferase
MNTANTCCLCSQIVGDASNDLFFRLVGKPEYVRRIPLESAHFAAVPSLGPLVEGHTLLCPKGHVKSFASLSARFDAEFYDFKRELRGLLNGVFKSPIHYFEHGMSKTGDRLLCTVDHAHLHLVPTNVSIMNRIERYGVRLRPIQNTLPCLREEAGKKEYLFYEAPTGDSFILDPVGKTVESQFLRKVFAEAIGRNVNWDWRASPLPTDAEKCFQRLTNSRSA